MAIEKKKFMKILPFEYKELKTICKRSKLVYITMNPYTSQLEKQLSLLWNIDKDKLVAHSNLMAEEI